METRRDHRVPRAVAFTVVVAAAVFGLAPAAIAESGDQGPIYLPPTVTVDTQPDSVVIDAEVHGHAGGTSGGGTQASGKPSCYLQEVRDMDDDMTMEYWRRRMMYAPYYVICGSENRGVVWIEITLDSSGNPPPARITPRDIAMRLRDEIPIPGVDVEINPGRGMVGMESWFWLGGYNGQPVTDSTDAFGSLVEVEARVTRYEWSFGDGVVLTSDSPGKAYPSRSEVRHIYERSSSGLPSGYRVDVRFEFTVRFRVNGGGWVDLPAITREAHADYPVRESQAVIER